MLEKIFKAHAKTGYLVTMSGAIEMVALSYEVSGSIPIRGCTDLYCSVKGGGITASQLDLPSLTSLSVLGGSRLQLGVTHWATSVA